MKNSIVLIGPIGAGKSTVGELLAKALKLPQVSMDDLRFEYYKEISYDENLAKQKRETEGFWGMYSYWKPFEAYSVERILEDHASSVIDLGAGHSVYEDETLFERVGNALNSYPHVILLLPSPDPDESIRVLNEREEWLKEMQPNINEHFVRHPSNARLAKQIVYTKDKSPQETCNEILNFIG